MKMLESETGFLPVSKAETDARGWESPDFVLVTGDAYVDHPSFGAAVIGRVLENAGYKVAVLAQPDHRSGAGDFRRFGRPRLGFLITGGAVDSAVNNHTVAKRRRKQDVYSPGGVAGKRPDRAVITYANRAKEAYRDVAVILGGLEASLRRLAHYDYWDDRVRRSILLDAKADILCYGPGENAILEIAAALNDGFPARSVTWVRGTVARAADAPSDALRLPDFETAAEPAAYARGFRMQYENNEAASAKPLCERYADGLFVVQNPPQPPLSQAAFDAVCELPYTGRAHPVYDAAGGVPAAREIAFSLIACRGCFGACAFCALSLHQGRFVTGRSRESLVREAEKLTRRPDFKGYIHDVGGPTANFRHRACAKQERAGACTHRDCLWPKPCPELETGHGEYMDILRALRALPGIKKVFIRSGIRYDYVLASADGDAFIDELCAHHVSGQLKVAPEHVSPETLKRMRKPPAAVYERFAAAFARASAKHAKKQYLLPYFISSHPGCTLNDAVDLALWMKRSGFAPDQVQDFYPTPGTPATCMYFTGLDPLTGEAVYTAKSLEEKRLQRALLHFAKPENRKLARAALRAAGREADAARLFGEGRERP